VTKKISIITSMRGECVDREEIFGTSKKIFPPTETLPTSATLISTKAAQTSSRGATLTARGESKATTTRTTTALSTRSDTFTLY
jgi:hypothetical protein